MPMCFYVFTQYRIDHGLVATTSFFKKLYDVRVEPKRYLLLRSGPENGLLEKVRGQLGDVRRVDIFILHGLEPRPVRL